MKKVVLIQIFLTIGYYCAAQRVSYQDLQFVLNHNLGQVEEYLSKKGFNYDGVDTINTEPHTYSSNFFKRSKNFRNNITISKYFQSGESIESSFDTQVKSDYLAFKSYIKTIGFKLVGNRTGKNGSLDLIYNNDKMTITFTIGIISPFKNVYIIALTKKD
jgi:hypothetical protein